MSRADASIFTCSFGFLAFMACSAAPIERIQRGTVVLLASMWALPSNTSGKFVIILRAMPRCCCVPSGDRSPHLPSDSLIISAICRITSLPTGVSLPNESAFCSAWYGWR